MDYQEAIDRLRNLQQKVRDGAELSPEEREELALGLDCVIERMEAEQETIPTSQASGKSNAPVLPKHPKGCTCISCTVKRGG